MEPFLEVSCGRVFASTAHASLSGAKFERVWHRPASLTWSSVDARYADKDRPIARKALVSAAALLCALNYVGLRRCAAVGKAASAWRYGQYLR